MYIILSLGIAAAIIFVFVRLFTVRVTFQGEHVVIRHIFSKFALSKQEIDRIEVTD
ncbi:hypothetical protein [Paenibacillus lentus]|uniref:hypothetical protein n=1 Tax=Paenibacillus lentus TaxID=1338368 RepID=UPI0013DDCF44|nr:hypothetical protein [Paenibacillus lentus]